MKQIMNELRIGKLVAGITVAVAVTMGTVCHADNPVVQTCFTADPAPMVYNDTVYLYTSHDEDDARGFHMLDWKCYSTTDMVNWTDHGSPLSVKDFSWAKSDAWAGQCIERNGKFYYYVPMNQKNGGMAVGVAVSDSPTGPFKDALGHLLVTTGWGDIDPTVYIDDDGQAYLYWGNPQLYYVKLNQDMISFDASIGNKGVVKVPLTEEGFGKRNGDPKRATLYEEGPWFYKRNGLYYMVYAASGIPENICYATSTNATGPWTFKGVIIPTQGRSFTDHPGVADYKGHSYMFYHNGALPGGGGFTRSVCIEEFKYNADGTFPTINMTKDGPAPLGHLNPFARTEAETIAWESGIKTAQNGDVGVYVTAINNGAYIKVCSVDFGGKGASKFLASVASVTDGGAIELRLDGLSGELIGTLKVKPTGALDKWKTQSCRVRGAKGVHDLYFKFTGNSSPLMNFDWWKFNK
jgi:arabinoxylan arabinofuranohydrolase